MLVFASIAVGAHVHVLVNVLEKKRMNGPSNSEID